MSKAILGTKLGMSQVFAENGDLVPVTVVEVLPNVVAGVKTVETDGYCTNRIRRCQGKTFNQTG